MNWIECLWADLKHLEHISWTQKAFFWQTLSVTTCRVREYVCLLCGVIYAPHRCCKSWQWFDCTIAATKRKKKELSPELLFLFHWPSPRLFFEFDKLSNQFHNHRSCVTRPAKTSLSSIFKSRTIETRPQDNWFAQRQNQSKTMWVSLCALLILIKVSNCNEFS